MSRIEVAVAANALLGEGPIWDVPRSRLLWVDIGSCKVHAFDPESGQDAEWSFKEAVTAICPATDGRYVAATATGVCELDLDRASLAPIAALPSGDRMNDAKADPGGRFVGGTLTAARTPGASGLYRMDRPGQLDVLVKSATVANGLGWSPDATRFYFVDSPTCRIDVFDYDDATGNIAHRRVLADLHDSPGRPDGLTVDEEDCIWVAMIRGGRVLRLSPTGEVVETIEMPASNVTSCTFGGRELSDLYITSGSAAPSEITASTSPAGALFRIPTGTRGLPPTPCRVLENTV